MKIIACIDSFGGLLFGGRRQSRDRVLIDDLMKYIGDCSLIISPFSAPLFVGRDVKISKKPLSAARAGDYIFIEDIDVSEALSSVSEIVLYKWNKSYPRDTLLGFEPSKCGFSLCESVDFVGSSHEKITREVYRR